MLGVFSWISKTPLCMALFEAECLFADSLSLLRLFSGYRLK